jgi:hypothetical protein
MSKQMRKLAVPAGMLLFCLTFFGIASFSMSVGQLTPPAGMTQGEASTYSTTEQTLLSASTNTTEIETSSVLGAATAMTNRTETNVDAKNKKKDWYQKDRFASNRALSRSCKIFENVCHSSGRWWYQPSSTQGAEQPSFMLLTNLRGAKGYPAKIRVNAPKTDNNTNNNNEHDDPRMSNRTCHDSPVHNHVVLHSDFDNMLGEFYMRVLVGLNEMMRTQVDANRIDDFLTQTQLYVHMYDKNDRSMLDSHHAFTDAFRGHPLQDFKSLLDNSGCQCLPRLFLCGYRRNKSQSKKENTKVFEPGNGIYPWGAGWNYDAFHQLRQTIRQRVIKQNPMALDDIQAYKEMVLKSKGVEADFDDWKLMGLAQRSGRRRWLNLKENEQACNQALRRYKILCTEINVEIKESNPYRQVITHGALDGLFGIHGAQLAEAIWMKPRSLVVEFLPWLHKAVGMGGWTRRVGAVTPLGAIYFNTDLNHIGYPLRRHSAPYCYGIESKEETKCWRAQSWDNRNFIGTSESIIDSVKMFFVNRTDDYTDDKCANYQEWAKDDFVLYNIQCYNGKNGWDIRPQHFYWKKELNKIPEFVSYSKYANFTG